MKKSSRDHAVFSYFHGRNRHPHAAGDSSRKYYCGNDDDSEDVEVTYHHHHHHHSNNSSNNNNNSNSGSGHASSVAAAASASAAKRLPSWQGAALAAMYTVSGSIFTLAIRHSQVTYGSFFMYDSILVVFLIELGKLIACCVLYQWQEKKSLLKTVFGGSRASRAALWRAGRLTFIPSLLYVLYNNLTFTSLGLLDVVTYQMLMQTRMVFTGFIFTLVLRTPLSLRQWMVLVALMFICAAHVHSGAAAGDPSDASAAAVAAVVRPGGVPDAPPAPHTSPKNNNHNNNNNNNNNNNGGGGDNEAGDFVDGDEGSGGKDNGSANKVSDRGGSGSRHTDRNSGNGRRRISSAAGSCANAQDSLGELRPTTAPTTAAERAAAGRANANDNTQERNNGSREGEHGANNGGDDASTGSEMVMLLKVLCVVLQAALASLAGVYNEYVFKKNAALSIHVQNFFMYFSGLFFNVLVALVFQPRTLYNTVTHLRQSLHWSLLPVVLSGVFLGIPAAFILKFIDSIVKTIAAAVEVIMTALLAALLLGESLSATGAVAVAMLVASVVVYNTPGWGDRTLITFGLRMKTPPPSRCPTPPPPYQQHQHQKQKQKQMQRQQQQQQQRKLKQQQQQQQQPLGQFSPGDFSSSSSSASSFSSSSVAAAAAASATTVISVPHSGGVADAGDTATAVVDTVPPGCNWKSVATM